MKSLKRFLPVLFVVFVLFFGSSCTNNTDNNTDNISNEENVGQAEQNIFYEKSFPLKLSNDIEITKCFFYDGEFPEDGSFDEKNNVLALKVINNSDKDLQLVRIYLTTDKKECLFEITTLPSKKAVTVLEKTAQTLASGEKILEIREENKIFFENKLSLNSDKFLITPLDKVLNIENTSGQDIMSDVYVYFKKKDVDGDYFGGITFRSNAGTLKSGEFKQIPASNFRKQDSEVLLVDYDLQ